MNFSLSNRLVCVNLGDRLLHRSETSGSLLRGLLCLGCAIAGIQSMGISIIGLAHRIADAFGCTPVHIGDHLGILGREFIKLIHAAADGIKLPADIFLAGKGVQLSPETSMTLILQALGT